MVRGLVGYLWRYGYNRRLVKAMSMLKPFWAGSLVRIGRRPPKPVVVGSNPTPPATTKSRDFATFSLKRMNSGKCENSVKRITD